MEEQEYHDLLIRLDTRFSDIKEDVKIIKAQLSGGQCQAHAERIKALERVPWGTFVVAVGAIVRSFWGVVSGQ